jgi:protein-disulfide isomerase
MSTEEIAIPTPPTPLPSARDPKTDLINTILIILGFIGIFIAGYLSFAKMQNLLVPCTEGSHDCATVDASEMSMLFGKVYVGYLGLAGYLILTGLAIARGFLAGKDWSTFVKAGLAMSGFGTLFSFYLTFYAIAQLQATCIWCICSALTMAATLVLSYLLLTRKAPEAPGKSPLLAAGVGFVLFVGLFGFFANKLKTELEGFKLPVNLGDIPESAVLPRTEKITGGGAEAPVVLVEFADFNCPACRGSFAGVHDAVKAGGPKLGYAFRNFPLFNQEGHETSLDFAIISEYAADKGKFFDFVNAAFDPKNNANVKAEGGILIIAEEAGLDVKEVQFVLDNPKDSKSVEYLESVNKDMAMARSLGALSTPTFIVMAKGQKPVAVPHTMLAPLFSSQPYSELLK